MADTPLRFLFGPVTAEFAATYLGGPRCEGRCLAFGPAGPDPVVGPGDPWPDISSRLPAGWRPELIALWLNYAAVPPGLWAAPVPIVGLATDWNLLWHPYRHLLPRCDAVLADRPGVEVLTEAGLGFGPGLLRPAHLFG